MKLWDTLVDAFLFARLLTGYGLYPVHRTGCGVSHIRCTRYDHHIRCTRSDTVISGARHRIWHHCTPDLVHRTGCSNSHIRYTGYGYHIRCTGSDTVISGAGAPDMAPLHPIWCTAPDVATPASGAPDLATISGATDLILPYPVQCTGYGTISCALHRICHHCTRSGAPHRM